MRPSPRLYLTVCVLALSHTASAPLVRAQSGSDAGVSEQDGGVDAPLAPLSLDAGLAPSEPTADEAPTPVAPAQPPVVEGQLDVEVRVQRPAGPGEFEPGGTGSKQNVPLLELPATVNTVSEQTLRERGVTDLQGALGLIPGVMPMWQYGGFQSIQMRGFQAFTLFDGRRDARAIFADSAPQMGLDDLERIEVLRGPSAVLYGYGAVGGVVNLIRKRPSHQNESELDLGLGTPKQLRAHVGSQGEITRTLGYRVDLGHTTYRNYRGYESQRNQATATVRYTPTQKQALHVRLSYAFDRYSTDVGVLTIEDPARPGHRTFPAGTRNGNRYAGGADHLAYQRLELAADYRYEFTSSTYLDARASITRDHYDYLAAEGLAYVPATAEMQNPQVARESLAFARGWLPILGSLELHSTQHTGPVSHQLVLGYSIDSFGGKSDRFNLGDYGPSPVDFSFPVDRGEKPTRVRTSYDHYAFLNHALYAFDHIELIDDLILTGGVRLDFLRNRTRREFVDRLTGKEIPEPGKDTTRPTNETNDFATTGQVGLVYQLLEPLTTYVSYASGFLPHFVFPSQTKIDNYQPERSQQFESGLRVRADQSGHSVQLDAAGYLIRKSNVVLYRGLDQYSQAGLVQSRGMELTAQYRAPYLVQLDAGYALCDAEYKKYATDETDTPTNYAGKVPSRAPRHSGTVWLRLVPTERMQLGVGSRVMGTQWADDANTLELPRYALLDMAASFGTTHAIFTVSANNLLNERSYYPSVINGGQLVTPGAGREILGTIRLKL